MKAFLAAMVAAACLFAGPGRAATELTGSGAWIRALPGDLPAAGYLVLHNPGEGPVRVLGVSGARFHDVMIHRSENAGGTERMVAVPDLTIPGHGEVAFAPEGLHLMLMGARPPLKPGERVDLRFTFDAAPALSVPFAVKDAAADGP